MSPKMTVDVSLCGCIPRSEMTSLRLQGNSHHQTDSVIAMAASNLTRKVSGDSLVMSSQDMQIPSWAVPARGECILEPVSDLIHLHQPVDLTSQAVFYIGRSDTSDLQLLHTASSRRHAILFHHPNGNCYIFDCGSSHGTFINGVRVTNTTSGNNKVVPQRVKRGSLLRFGGPGAPSFILKSFSVALGSLINNFDSIKSVDSHVVEEEPTARVDCSSDLSMEALVTLNTRLNSVSSMSSLSSYSSYGSGLDGIQSSHQPKKRMPIESDLEKESPKKKPKLEEHLCQSDQGPIDSASFSVVSPIRSQKPVLRMDLGLPDRPIVSPNPFDESSRVLKTANIPTLKSCITAPLDLPPVSRKKKSVGFSDEPPQVFFAQTVTPESASDSEGASP